MQRDSTPASALPLTLSEEVADILACGGAVVALESTILTHGLPQPANLEIGQAAEAAVRSAGAVPATTAVLDGVIHVGLSADQLDRVCALAEPLKIARSNLAVALAGRLSGGTTVSATMIAAAAAGITIFATGGIGGVHRQWTLRPDISADLAELARTPVAVVSAGPKIILDLPATAEVLESLGVPVLGYRTHQLPGFYVRDGGVPVTARVESPEQAAAILKAHLMIRPATGLLIAQPLPVELALDREHVEQAIAEALTMAMAQGIQGAAVTPFLLARLSSLTSGQSVTANRDLMLANATLAAKVALALAALG